MDIVNFYDSPVGSITLASDGTALVGLWFQGQKYYMDTLGYEWEEGTDNIIRQASQWLDDYFGGKIPGSSPPLSFRGTPFRQRVWSLLLEIPYGETVTYGDLSRSLGLGRNGPRAVGGSVGRNPISIIVPCHRVIGANGALTGYAGGLERKTKLLKLEKKRS